MTLKEDRPLLRWTEAKKAIGVPLSNEEARWLTEIGVATVTPGHVPGTFDVQVGNYAGVLARGDLRVNIEPKIDVGSLMWMAVYGRTQLKLDSEDIALETIDFLTLMAQIYIRYLDEAIGPGLLTGYWSCDDIGTTLRGRIRLTEQMNRHHGRLYPLELSYEEFGANIPENQVLLAALESLVRALGADPESRRRSDIIGQLKRRADAFHGVDRLVGWGGIGPVRTRLNDRYATVLPLAELILDSAGLDARSGQVWGTSFLLDVWRVFESSVARAVATACRDLNVQTQLISQFVDGHSQFTMRPDIAIKQDDRVVAILDTKYKAADPKASDIYQMFTYASFYRTKEAHLIYAASSVHKGPSQLAITDTGITIHLHAIDLERPNLTLESDVTRMMETVLQTAAV